MVSAIGVSADRDGGIEFSGCCGWCSASVIVVLFKAEVVIWYVGGGSGEALNLASRHCLDIVQANVGGG